MTKKKLPVRFTGQHFTIDKVLIKDAIRQANISNQDTVLDIGAGKGFLTVHLLKIANNVVAIENDTALVEHLRKLFSDARNVQVVGCDFRNFAVPKFPFKVVSNIPYGITIIRKSKFPQNPKRSVRFSGKRTKRSVQKRKARNTQKAETKVL